jgi:type 1 fimbria pilin
MNNLDKDLKIISSSEVVQQYSSTISSEGNVVDMSYCTISSVDLQVRDFITFSLFV